MNYFYLFYAFWLHAFAAVSVHRKFSGTLCTDMVYLWCHEQTVCVSSNPCCMRTPFHKDHKSMVSLRCVFVHVVAVLMPFERIYRMFGNRPSICLHGSVRVLEDLLCDWTSCHKMCSGTVWPCHVPRVCVFVYIWLYQMFDCIAHIWDVPRYTNIDVRFAYVRSVHPWNRKLFRCTYDIEISIWLVYFCTFP